MLLGQAIRGRLLIGGIWVVRQICLLVFWDRVSLCSFDCPGNHFVDQIGLNLERSALLCLLNARLKVCATTTQQDRIFVMLVFLLLLINFIVLFFFLQIVLIYNFYWSGTPRYLPAFVSVQGLKVCTKLGMLWGRWISEFKANLVYLVSSKTARPP